MALVLADRVQETTTTTGTGSITLGGAVPGFQTFAVVGNTNTCYYTIVDGSAWEVGIGTYSTTGPTLARTTILSNSLGTLVAITLTAGTKNVFLTYPAERAITGPSSSTANGIVLFDGVTGNIVKDSSATDGLIQGMTVGLGAGSNPVNTAFGLNTLNANTSGNANTAIGWLALTSTTSGSNNTSVGYYANALNQLGSGNSSFGTYTGSAVTGSNNTAIGSEALRYATSGSNNTAIGYQAGSGISTGGKNVIIGSYAGLIAPISMTGSNYIVFSDGDANIRGYFNSSGVFNIANLTASSVVFTDASKNLVSTGTVAVNQGGTGTTTPALVAGTNITITGSWPNQTINSSNTGGTVTSVAATVPAFLSVAGSPITSSGTLAITLSGTALPVANGGTGQTTANTAFNALAPSQTGNSGKYLTTNGTDTSWAVNASGDVVGPASATANGIALFNSTTGKLIKDSASTDGLIQGMTVGLGGGSIATNTALGVSALAVNTTGTLNTAIGYQAGQSITTGQLNTVIGYRAGSNITTGINNTYIGVAAGSGSTATTGSSNTGVGYNALTAIATTAEGNSTFGSIAGQNITTANYNSAFGYQTLALSTTGANNTVYGAFALQNSTTASGNTALGYQSGQNITTGAKNVIIGSYTGLGAPISATGSNYIIFSDGDANVRGYFNSSGVFNIANLTASKPVFTDASKNLVSTGTLGVDQGGTGLTTTPANGALDIGNGTGFTRTTLTAGSGVTITNASGAITINATGTGGDVVGPASATNNGIVLFDGTTGKIIKDSAASDGLIYGITIGRGGGGLSSNTALGSNALTVNTTGASSTAVGLNTLSVNTTGSENTAIGRGTLFANTTGSSNTAIGRSALIANTTASNNTAVGHQAGLANTTGTSLVYVGYQAGKASTTADSNTAVGDRSLQNTTTGAGNTALGGLTLQTNTTGASNTALGLWSLFSNTTATGNTSTGYFSMRLNSTGADNTANGIFALENNTTGSYNVALGSNALNKNTTASNNTAVGYQAGYSNTTGAITAVGRLALYSHTTGTSNVALGNSAGYGITTGNYNIAIGESTLYSNATASNNIAIGYTALGTNTTGDRNTVVGNQAGYTNATGTVNTFIGYRAGYSNYTTSGCVFVGAYVGENSTGNNNVAVGGANVGVTNTTFQANTTGSGNTAVGAATMTQNTTGSNNTAMGYLALQNNTTSSELTAFGTNAGQANTSGQQNTYIGKSAGTAVTTGWGNLLVGNNTGNALTTGSGNTFIGGSDGRSINPCGSAMTTGSSNVIIGGYSGNSGGLDIRTASNYVVLSDGGGNIRGMFDNSGNFLVGTTSLPSGGGIVTASSSAAETKVSIVNTGTSGRHYWLGSSNTSSGSLGGGKFAIFDQTATAVRLVIDSSGDLMVGGTSVLQSAKITAYGAVAAQNGGVDGGYQNAFVSVYSGNANEHNVIKTAVSAVGTSSGFQFKASNGAGSSSTTTVLDLTRTQTIFYTDGGERARITSGGQFLIGTTSAAGSEKLRVTGTSVVGTSFAARFNQNNTSNGSATLLGLSVEGSSWSKGAIGFVRRTDFDVGDLVFCSNASTSTSDVTLSDERMRLTYEGNLGVGTTSPSGADGKAIVVYNSAGPSRLVLKNNSTGDAGGDGFQLAVSGTTAYIEQREGSPLVFTTSNTERMRLDADGKFMLGTTSALNSGGAKASIQFAGGQGLFIATETQGNGQVMGFNYNITTNVGSISITSTTTSYTTTSDQRLKENIQDADSASSLIDSLQVRQFNWKADGSHQRYGFIAQELVTVAPEAVTQPEESEQMMSVDYSKLVPMLVKEIQSLRKRLADAGI
jgi:hypothetical protein